MKNLLKATLVALVLTFATNINAQSPISVGVKAGLNVSNQSYKSEGLNVSGSAKVGFNAGLTLDINLPSNLAVMSGLELTTKGVKFDIEDTKTTFNAMYLQLPIHLGYKIEIAPQTKIHFNAGPYLAYGIGGKIKNSYDNEKMDTFGDDALKRFDFGLGIGAGVTFVDKVQVRLGYDFGLADAGRKGTDEYGDAYDVKVKNRNFYVSLGYLFF